MHVGIHADTYDFFLVGESHRELLLTGPGVTRTVAMESGAEAGEILVSDETAATLPDEILGEPKEGGRLLKLAPGASGGIEPLPPLEGDRSRRLRARARSAAWSRTVAPSPSTGRPRSPSSISAASTPCSPNAGAERVAGVPRRAGHGRAAGGGRARRHVPRDRHRCGRRQDDPRRRRARDGGRGRGAHSPHRARDRRPHDRAAAPDRHRARPRLRGRGRRPLPAHLHDPRQDGRARRAADGQGQARPGADHQRTCSSAHAAPSRRSSSSR